MSSTEKESKLPKWTTRQIAEEKGREYVLETTLREVLYFSVFVVVATIATIGTMSTSMLYLTKAMEGEFLGTPFSVDDTQKNFESIRTEEDMWSYIETVVIDKIYIRDNQPTRKDPFAKILKENKVLGVPRLRQVKVGGDTCTIHEYFRGIVKRCFAPYSNADEDTKQFGIFNSNETPTAWSYWSGEKTGSKSYWAKLATYGGGGYYQNFDLNVNVTMDIINILKENNWITRGTRCVFIELNVYNANLNLFSVTKLIFEFSPTGGIIPSADFNVIQLISYVTTWDYFVLAMEIVSFGFILFYTFEELREVLYFKLRYLGHFWNWIDLTILLLGYLCLIFGIIRVVYAKQITALVKKTGEYSSFDYIAMWHIYYESLFAITLFFIYIKIFKYLSFNHEMSQLNNTLSKCAMDILAFSIMFFVMFIAYAQLGYLLFGSQVKSYNGVGIAMFTLLRTILGDFDYLEIENANRVLAPVYFLSYIFFIFFVLLNMFLAIITDAYTEVKTEVSISPDEMQMSQFVKRGFFNLMRKCCGWKRKEEPMKEVKNEFDETIEAFRATFKRFGFGDMEIEMFFSRYNIDSTAEVGDYDFDELMTKLEKKQEWQAPRESGKKGSKTDGDLPMVTITEFAEQQERLEQIEKNVRRLKKRVDNLLEKQRNSEKR